MSFVKEFERGVARARGSREHQVSLMDCCCPCFFSSCLLTIPHTHMKEDEFSVTDGHYKKHGYALFSVFDGHATDEYSKHCKRHMHSRILNSQAFREGNYREALIEGFNIEDESLKSNLHNSSRSSDICFRVDVNAFYLCLFRNREEERNWKRRHYGHCGPLGEQAHTLCCQCGGLSMVRRRRRRR